MKPTHFIVAGDSGFWRKETVRTALTAHYPEYERDSRSRTRISVLVGNARAIHDFVFEYQELFDNSYWRVVDLTGGKPNVDLHRPQYEGRRKDFVDVEWEFIIGHLSHPILQEKLRRWANDPKQRLTISIGYEDAEKSRSIAEKLIRRLPDSVKIEVKEDNVEEEAKQKPK